MTTYNSVLRLRSKQLLQSTRTFKARGFKVKRCDICLIPKTECICSQRPKVTSQCAFCLLMYKDEYYKPSNTGRIIADVIPDNYAFLWHRVTPDPDLLKLLNNPKYAPILVFPHEYALPDRCITSPLESTLVKEGKIPLFIMLDGTWREAKKMFKSPSLANIPVLGIQPTQTSNYRLREAAQDHQLCTAEVAIEILKLANDQHAAAALDEYFKIFREAYIVGKPHLK
ncbi:tRNA-uridine aminocarboxypropyltransferase [Paraglaciecola sp.]|uniref:tRNA-uridine aminocarboxypropyltransferase n=1 Tax=Paraglaciecola sp. TaxID=1920173 RepID=UPI003EF1930F